MRIKHLIVIILVIVILYATHNVNEGFINESRCGVDLPSCTSGLRCINGYCKSDNAPMLPSISDLPIIPNRYE